MPAKLFRLCLCWLFFWLATEEAASILSCPRLSYSSVQDQHHVMHCTLMLSPKCCDFIERRGILAPRSEGGFWAFQEDFGSQVVLTTPGPLSQ